VLTCLLLLDFIYLSTISISYGGNSRKFVKEDKFLTELLSSEGKVYKGKERKFHFHMTSGPFRTKYP